MVIKKQMTIKELFDELKVLESRLINLSHRYNRTLTITAISWKDIVIKGGKRGDVMLNQVIKKDDIKNEFDIVKESYDSYKEEVIEKIRDMISKESVEYCIVYFRDNLIWKWKDIAKLFNYSIKQCQRLYKKEKTKVNVS